MPTPFLPRHLGISWVGPSSDWMTTGDVIDASYPQIRAYAEGQHFYTVTNQFGAAPCLKPTVAERSMPYQ